MTKNQGVMAREAVEIVSLDREHSIQLTVLPMPTVRSRLYVHCLNWPGPDQGWVEVLASVYSGFAMDNLTWSRSRARGDKLALSNRELTDHLLLDLPAGKVNGTVFYSTTATVPGAPRPEPFKIHTDGRSILALRRWLLSRDEAAIADRLPDLRVAGERAPGANWAA